MKVRVLRLSLMAGAMPGTASDAAAGIGGVDQPSRLTRVRDSDLAYSFRRSPVAIGAAVVLALCLGGALFAPWVAPHNPFDLATLNLLDALVAAATGMAGAKPGYLLGTDDQGRDVLSAIMFGARISLLVGLASVAVGDGDRA